ncbi:paralemmin-3 isoform X2 [Festucalex cinctus]
MDEAEKYQQRLEAIAEKRRLQEEQERAKREMEDEKLRLQQLKRKSLRDQWLMEGAPLSQSSGDSQSPRSPSWASQEVGNHRLLSWNAGFAGEDAKQQIAEDQTEAVDMEAGDMGIVEDYAAKAIHEAASVMNGEGDCGLKHHEDALEKPVTTNGPSGSVPVEENHLSCVEVDEGVLIMQAERVVITDEDDEEEEEEEVAPQERPKEGGVIVEVQVAPEASKELAADETSVAAKQAERNHEETKGKNKKNVLQSTADPLGVTPVYSQSKPACPPSEEAPQGQDEEAAILPAAEAAHVSSKGQGDTLATPPPYQEVPLSDLTENHRTEALPAERQPLLEEAKAPEVQDDVATDNQSLSTETQAEAVRVPKAKTCLCCSVM